LASSIRQRVYLTKEDGNNEQAIEEIAKIANWDMKGGAPRPVTHNSTIPLLG
jgi:hypothetical protein